MPTYVDLGPLTRRLDLDSLRLFSVVCTQGSYARAARIEPLTPSAISKRMSDLERTMGCVLLERSSLGVRPTAAGELVLAQWIEMAQALERLTHVADHMGVGGNAQLSVAADADAARFLAFDCLGHSQAQEVAGRVDIARAPLHWLPVEIERRTAQAAVWCLSPGGDGSRATRLASVTFEQFRGTRNFRFDTRPSHSELHAHLRIAKGYKRPRDGFFLRAESFFNVATHIEHMDADPAPAPPVIHSYGGVSLHEQSHGESFMALMMNRFGGQGLYLLDEPEAALSPQRQLAALARIHDLACDGSQFIIATHSPILMAYPDAWIYRFDSDGVTRVTYEETEHFQVMQAFMRDPQRMLRSLMAPD